MKLKATVLTLFAAGLLAGLTLIAPATGADGPTTTTTGTVYTSGSGTLDALSATSITVGSLTCSRNSTSPSLDGYKLGDAVGIGCGNGVLIVVSDHRTTTTTTTTPATTTTTSNPQGARDPITALSATSITVGQLTCSISPTSPAVTFHVGDRVRMGCLNGVMVYVVADTPSTTTTTTTTTPEIQTKGGTLTAIGSNTITVDGTVCAVYPPTSPSIAGFKVGDKVGIACQNAVLIKIVLTDSSSSGSGDTQMVTRSGTLTALGSGSISVNDFTCKLLSTSPSLDGYKVGDQVGIGCLSGVLMKIARLQPTTGGSGGGDTNIAITRAGLITALSTTSITVGELTCTLRASSPDTSGFKVGDKVGIACVGGVLAKIVATPGDDNHDVLQTRLGPIRALTDGSITVDDLTCKIGSSSPSVSAFQVGDMVGIGCSNGVLVKIGNAPFGGDDGGFRVAVTVGSIARLSADLIRVGNLACELATTSPSVASFKVGDRVGIGCAGGILFMIGALPSASDAPTAEVKDALVKRFSGCIKKGSERCTVASTLRRFKQK